MGKTWKRKNLNGKYFLNIRAHSFLLLANIRESALKRLIYMRSVCQDFTAGEFYFSNPTNKYLATRADQ